MGFRGASQSAGLSLVLVLLIAPAASAASLLEFDFENFVNGQISGGPSYAVPELSTGWWSSDNNGVETWGPLGKHSLTRFFGDASSTGGVNAPFLSFTTTESIRLDSVSFNHEHNHNFGFPTQNGYDVVLQLDSGGGYSTFGTFSATSDNLAWKLDSIAGPSAELAPGKHYIRWFPTLALSPVFWNTNTEYFGLDNVVLEGQVLYSAPAPSVPAEPQSDYVTSGPSGWNTNYDLEFSGGAVTINLDIMLIGDDPGAALKAQWKDGIEGIWSDVYNVSDGVYEYPILVNVNWVTTPGPDTYIVDVTAGYGQWSMTNWFTVTDWSSDYQDELSAHEAGHMMALYDEYTEDPNLPDGTLDPLTLFMTTNSIMADLGPPREWHFQTILDWLAGRIDRSLELAGSNAPPYPQDPPIPNFHDGFPGIPEPGAGVLLGLGLGVVGVLVRGRRRRARSSPIS